MAESGPYLSLGQVVSREQSYRYAWRNNEKRATLYGRRCVVICRGKMNSAMVEFENGQREVVSRSALRKS